MDDTDVTFHALPLGAGAILAIIIVVGFIGLIAYQAWMHGPTFIVPVRDLIAILIIGTFLFTIAYMLGSKIPEAGDIMLGALVAGFAAIVAFYFSRDKPPNGK
jgi:Ca2+/Na+ antiporter